MTKPKYLIRLNYIPFYISEIFANRIYGNLHRAMIEESEQHG